MTEQEPFCEMPDYNPPTEEIAEVLKTSKTIALVGASDKPERDSYQVMKYLLENGYQVIPVNPSKGEILGKKCYPSLADIPGDIEIDVVDIFRKPEALAAVVDEALARGTKAIWMQLGLAHNAAAEKARARGVRVVMNKCMKIEHKRLSFIK